MKKKLKMFIRFFGYELKNLKTPRDSKILNNRPVGRMDTFLEDLKIRGLECKTILDVGANSSSWSRIAKKIFPEAYFYLIEPQVEMEEKLKAFTNEFSNSAYLLQGAGAKKEILTLTIWEDLAGSSLLPREEEKLLSNGKQRKIEIVAINDLIEGDKIRMPELIKLDIQGFELEALKGATKTFGHTEVYILEVSLFPFSDGLDMPVMSDVINFMLGYDYVVYDFAGFLRRPLDGALGQCDICFVKKNSFLRKSNEWQ
ncbi:FkbM family methyltransferase [Flavobacterium sp.]|uniref:FkbM family methyltransferase n=1 Tax=Flavobacterium sp. TaxID=239 RepID=UPI0037506D14